ARMPISASWIRPCPGATRRGWRRRTMPVARSPGSSGARPSWEDAAGPVRSTSRRCHGCSADAHRAQEERLVNALATFGAVALAAAAAQTGAAMDVDKLLAERAETLASFKDPHRSPYAAVDRRDFQGKPLVLGSAPDVDLPLEGVRPRHARVAVEGEG